MITASRRLISSLYSAAFVLGVALTFVCSAFARHPPSNSLPAALTAIQTAFLSNDASRLARWFPRRGPVFVSIPPLENGTFLAPGPLKAFLDRLVRERLSVSLELPAVLPDVEERETASAFVKVKWTHRPPASGTLQVDYLHLSLRYAADDGEWRIVEIKTSLR